MDSIFEEQGEWLGEQPADLCGRQTGRGDSPSGLFSVVHDHNGGWGDGQLRELFEGKILREFDRVLNVTGQFGEPGSEVVIRLPHRHEVPSLISVPPDGHEGELVLSSSEHVILYLDVHQRLRSRRASRSSRVNSVLALNIWAKRGELGRASSSRLIRSATLRSPWL